MVHFIYPIPLRFALLCAPNQKDLRPISRASAPPKYGLSPRFLELSGLRHVGIADGYWAIAFLASRSKKLTRWMPGTAPSRVPRSVDRPDSRRLESALPRRRRTNRASHERPFVEIGSRVGPAGDPGARHRRRRGHAAPADRPRRPRRPAHRAQQLPARAAPGRRRPAGRHRRLRHHSEDRRGRNGHRVSRRGHPPAPQSRDQDAPARTRRQPGVPRPVRAGGPRRGGRRARPHRPHLAGRRGGRRNPVHRHAVPPGRVARRAALARAGRGRRPGAEGRPRGRTGVGRGARQGADPPRHQAGQHLARRRPDRGGAYRTDPPLQAPRLRAGTERRQRERADHDVRSEPRHAGVHVAGAGARRAGGSPQRPVEPGRHAAPHGNRHAPVQRAARDGGADRG